MIGGIEPSSGASGQQRGPSAAEVIGGAEVPTSRTEQKKNQAEDPPPDPDYGNPPPVEGAPCCWCKEPMAIKDQNTCDSCPDVCCAKCLITLEDSEEGLRWLCPHCMERPPTPPPVAMGLRSGPA